MQFLSSLLNLLLPSGLRQRYDCLRNRCVINTTATGMRSSRTSIFVCVCVHCHYRRSKSSPYCVLCLAPNS
ncbi:hypothetical protein V3C99_017771 [Haemonchus contortus]